MAKRHFRHLLCCLVAFAALAVCRPALANDIEVIHSNTLPVYKTYNIRVEVERTVDADGWDSAYIGVLTKKYNGRCDFSDEETARHDNYYESDDLADEFDEWKNTSYEVTSDDFPYRVAIFTDFGGGMSWRSWEADVTVFVNGVNIASKHITASSAPFSSSETRNTIDIDETNFPYLEKLIITAPESMETEGELSEVNFLMWGFDQYGRWWYDPSANDATESFSALSVTDSKGKTWERTNGHETSRRLEMTVSHEGPKDERVTYTVRAPTANSTEPESVGTFDIDYHYKHKVAIVKDGTLVSTHTGSMDDELLLDFPDLVEPGYALEWQLEGGGVLVPHTDAGPLYIFGDSNGKLTAKVTAYSYQLVLDGNGATGGKMSSRIMKVGKSHVLPANIYAKTGCQFVGWNTEPDGSGDFYQNKGVVKDLALEDGATVTLYAQWKPKTFTVTFVNKITGERMQQEVDYGNPATPPEMPEATRIDDKRHSTFVKWNKSFSEIKANTTITSVHKTEPHTFESTGETMVCHACGTTIIAAAYESSVFGDGSVHVVAAGFLVAVLAGLGAYAHARRGRKGSD